MKKQLLTLIAPVLIPMAPMVAHGESPAKAEQEALIPKSETGVLDFLKKHPAFDGREVVIAIFDTGVDPAAAGLQKTSTGERKIVDLIDGTGTGDVDTSHLAKVGKEGVLEGLSGRRLQLPGKIKNPSGKYHLGLKRARELFHNGVNRRISQLRGEAWARELGALRDARREEREAALKMGGRKAFQKAPSDLTLAEKDEVAREKLLEKLENDYASSDPGPVYDCVVWSDGKNYQVLIDTDEDGDLGDEKILRPFGVAGEYGTLGEEEASTFAVQVYEEGNLLSIVTVSGSHGSHVASIAAAHFPEAPHRDGVAPGAKILSIKIGDTRIGGSSSGVGEMRGVAACAQYGVDIMNASWGGASQYQDGGAFSSKLYNMLVEKYGVIAFVSAGNNGPALSTLGSPGGEASSIIGVGAYVSAEMVRVLYSQTSKTRDTSYYFSSRGPAKNGDLGVDITGPGGAHASLAYDELSNSERYHGTSMSSPSVAGLGALLVSAAKQSDIKHSPARIRSALMNSARFDRNLEVFAQGAGLVQALPAWESLKVMVDQPEWDHFYEVSTRQNTFRDGPGLYLRGDIPVGKKEVRFDLSPKFVSEVTAPEKFALENDLVFTATQPWVRVPGYARLGNGRITIRPILDLPASLPGQPLYAEIHGRLAGAPNAGPLVRIPITIIRGEKTDPHAKHRSNFALEINSGQTYRRFIEVPPHANFIKIRVRRDDGGPLARTVMLHAVTLVADGSFRSYESKDYLSLQGGEFEELVIPVAAGKTTELAFHQPFFSVGPTSLHADFQFMGAEADQELVVFHENEAHAPLRVITASDETVEGEGLIDRAHFSILPVKTEFLSPDPRDAFPPGPRQMKDEHPPLLRQTFHLSVEKRTKIELEFPRRFDAKSEIRGGLVMAYHESGKLVYQGNTYRNSGMTLPKGKTTFYRELRHPDRDLLERDQDRPLNYTMKLDKPKKLELFQSLREVMSGQVSSSVGLTKGRYHSLMVGAPALASLSSHKPAPHYFSGSFKLKQSEGDELELVEVRVECRPGEDFKSVANQKDKPGSLEAKKDPLEKLKEDLFQQKLSFVRSHRWADKADLQASRDEILAELLEEHPDEAEVHLLHAQIHAGDAGLLGKEVEEPSVKQLPHLRETFKKARELSKPRIVSNYFGARTENEEATLEERKKAAAKQKKMEGWRNNLAAIGLSEAEVLLRAGRPKQARRALRDIRRWEESPSKKYEEIEYELFKKEGHLGLALQKLNIRLKEAPFDEKLLDEKMSLFKELGFHQRFIDRIELDRKVLAGRVR